MHTENNEWCSNSELYYQNDDLLHVHSLHQEIRKEIIEIKPKKILDFGSGDGKLLCSIEYENIEEITLFDIDHTAVELAKVIYKNSSNARITKNEDDLKLGHYNLITCCNVLMCIPTKNEIEAIFKKMARLMSNNGTLLLGITHPCFLDRKFISFENEFSLKHKHFDYFSNGKEYNVYFEYNNHKVVIKDYFWNLTFILNCAYKASLKLSNFKEIKTDNCDYPPYLLIKFI